MDLSRQDSHERLSAGVISSACILSEDQPAVMANSIAVELGMGEYERRGRRSNDGQSIDAAFVAKSFLVNRCS